MAPRLLLTLLAVLTGLAAQFAPAQARVCGPVGTEIGEVANAGVVQRRTAPAALKVPPASYAGRDRETLPTCQLTDFGLRTSTVLQGIDRARE